VLSEGSVFGYARVNPAKDVAIMMMGIMIMNSTISSWFFIVFPEFFVRGILPV